MLRHSTDIVLILLTALAALSGPSGARAQDIGWLRLETDEPAAHVYVDSVYAGRAGQTFFPAPPGERFVRLVPPEHESWSLESAVRSVLVQAGDTTNLVLALPYYYRIESVPYGAQVYMGGPEGRWLGETPFTFRVDETLSDVIYVDKPGYLAASVTPGSDRWNRHVVTLNRSLRGGPESAGAEVDWSPPRARRSRWIDYTAIGVAVASGVVAVHYKFKADHLYARYEETGDPQLKDRIRAFDVRSGVALGAMQVGLGIFAVRLVLR